MDRLDAPRRGRPRLRIDLEYVEQMLNAKYSMQEVADRLEVLTSKVSPHALLKATEETFAHPSGYRPHTRLKACSLFAMESCYD